MESALYVKKKWGTIYGALGMRYGRKSCEWLQKEGSRCDHLLNWVFLTKAAKSTTGFLSVSKPDVSPTHMQNFRP